MENNAIKVYVPAAANLINWVAENPKKAAQVGIGLMAVGAAIVILDAIFRS
jgi:hypothetical protein